MATDDIGCWVCSSWLPELVLLTPSHACAHPIVSVLSLQLSRPMLRPGFMLCVLYDDQDILYDWCTISQLFLLAIYVYASCEHARTTKHSD